MSWGSRPTTPGCWSPTPPVAAYFDRALAAYAAGPEAAKKVANWLNGEVAKLANESGTGPAEWKLTPERLAAVLKLVDAGTIGGPGAKQVVEEVFRTGAEPAEVVQAKGLAQVSDEGAIEAVVDQVLAASPAEVEKHRGGKKDLTGFFVGKVMKELRGKGNPAVVNALLKTQARGRIAMAWAGWGAGPAGAGAAGGPSRWFQGAALAGSVVVAGILASRGRWVVAAACLAAAGYFALRALPRPRPQGLAPGRWAGVSRRRGL